MTTLYVDNIAPNLQTKISAPNLQLPSGTALQTKFARREQDQNFTQGNQYSYANATGLAVNITPSSTSSQFLITLCFRFASNSSSDNNVRILRTVNGVSTALRVHVDDGGLGNIYYANSSNSLPWSDAAFQYLDSPSTTSQITYQVQFANGQGTLRIGCRGDGGNKRDSTITVMEIAG